MRWILLLLVAAAVTSCQSQGKRAAEKSGGSKMRITVTSSSFKDGEMIPKKFTADGPDVSPDIAWTDTPSGAKSFALITDDPDAPSKVWVHWVAFNIPPEVHELPEAQPHGEKLPNGAVQGVNDMGKLGYNGPAPPSGVHRYYFKVYALDTMLDLKPGATKQDLLNAMEGHILAEGQVMGRYTRG